MPPPILYQSNHLIIIDKPAGLPCHPGPRTTASVEDFFPHWRRGHDGPWLAHRLDADTAGCLAIARRKTTLIALQHAFATHTVQKTYWAIVHGIPPTAHGTIDRPIAKRTTSDGWTMVIDPSGQPAITDWRILAQSQDRALLELTPRTGRTHQLRLHCATLGHPILGDALYGRPGTGLCLLARSLTLPLNPPITATAAEPPHFLHAQRAIPQPDRPGPHP